MSTALESFEHRVVVEQDRVWLAARAARIARSMGFDTELQARISLCVSELVTNAVRHAGGGTLRVREITRTPLALEVEMIDEGPGIASPDLALRDGYSRGRFNAPDDPPNTRRSLGIGLGALARLSSQFSCERREGGGTRIALSFVRSRTRSVR